MSSTEHDPSHTFGPFERSRFGDTVHRKCTEPGCKAITLDGDGCDCGDRECPECEDWYRTVFEGGIVSELPGEEVGTTIRHYRSGYSEVVQSGWHKTREVGEVIKSWRVTA